jgi:hypothetical protein
MNQPTRIFLLIFTTLTIFTVEFNYAQSGHFSPGAEQIRDYILGGPGTSISFYNYWYTSNRYNDNQGNKANSVLVGPDGKDTLDANVDFKNYSLSPEFTWISKFKGSNIKYSAVIQPTLATASIGAALKTVHPDGFGARQSEVGMGDLFVQPFGLGLTKSHWDFAIGYSFYAPTGKYNIDSANLPVSGMVKIVAPDNIGLGYWTNQFQAGVAWYPWPDQRLAFVSALTYEINGNQKGFDLTPGQNLSFNWGISQFLPLNKQKSLQLTIGITGYGSWQVSPDTGADATNTNQFDRVQAIGGQVGLIYQPLALSMSFHGFKQFNARNLFEGESYGLTIAKSF